MAQNVLRGRNLVLSLGTTSSSQTAVAMATSCKLSLTSTTVDSTVKSDSEAWDYTDIITRAFSITSDSLIKSTETTGVENVGGLIDAFLNGTLIYVKVTIGGINYTGQAYVTSIDADGAVKENAKFSATLTGNGPLAKAS